MTQSLSPRWYAMLAAMERRRWRIAYALAQESPFTVSQCRRLLFMCRDDVSLARRIAATSARRGWSLSAAYAIVAELARGPVEG